MMHQSKFSTFEWLKVLCDDSFTCLFDLSQLRENLFTVDSPQPSADLFTWLRKSLPFSKPACSTESESLPAGGRWLKPGAAPFLPPQSPRALRCPLSDAVKKGPPRGAALRHGRARLPAWSPGALCRPTLFWLCCIQGSLKLSSFKHYTKPEFHLNTLWTLPVITPEFPSVQSCGLFFFHASQFH